MTHDPVSCLANRSKYGGLITVGSARLISYTIYMSYGNGEILEMYLEPGGVRALISLPPSLSPAAGQYLLGFSAEAGDLLPVPLFPASLPGSQMRFAAPLPASWMAGMKLALRGPMGKGFRLPPGARRVALAAIEESAGALLPLAFAALGHGAEVALYADGIPGGLPAQVEVMPSDLLLEALAWADYLALDLPVSMVHNLPRLLGLKSHQNPSCPAEVLIRAPMPCAGIAECGACAIRTKTGWQLGCKDGPVFEVGKVMSD